MTIPFGVKTCAVSFTVIPHLHERGPTCPAGQEQSASSTGMNDLTLVPCPQPTLLFELDAGECLHVKPRHPERL
jgi:hypothetical protein